MKNKMGKVILVGAGAGDTGLLTIKGKKYIEAIKAIYQIENNGKAWL